MRVNMATTNGSLTPPPVDGTTGTSATKRKRTTSDTQPELNGASAHSGSTSATAEKPKTIDLEDTIKILERFDTPYGQLRETSIAHDGNPCLRTIC